MERIVADVNADTLTEVTFSPGKSAWLQRTLVLMGFEVVSLDAIREELSGDRADQTVNGRVRQAARERVKAALRAGRKVAWDAERTSVVRLQT